MQKIFLPQEQIYVYIGAEISAVEDSVFVKSPYWTTVIHIPKVMLLQISSWLKVALILLTIVI